MSFCLHELFSSYPSNSAAIVAQVPSCSIVVLLLGRTETTNCPEHQICAGTNTP